MKVLVIGVNTRHIACSASRAGYTVYTLGRFNDVDLKVCSEKSVIHDMSDVIDLELPKLAPLIRTLLPIDFIVLGPGFEHLGNWVEEITQGNIPVLNNPPHIFTRISDKAWLAGKLKVLNLPHPFTVLLDSLNTPEDWSGGYPAIIKPRVGAGGMENRLISDLKDLKMTMAVLECGQYLLQEYIKGTVASVSIISTGKQAVAIAVNEQLAGIDTLTGMPFAYCGNITPYVSEHNDWMRETSMNLAVELELFGSNGVDFIITDKGPVVLEINPRFQGSIDTVERSTGLNIFRLHHESFQGKLSVCGDSQCFSIKTIFFAPRRLVVEKKEYDYLVQCYNKGTTADVPSKGTVCEKDEPVVSFLSEGNSRMEVVRQVEQLVNGLTDIIEDIHTEV
ncbi:MAG: ATP-grasp domain-containing protein [ANME-2 cluster archaeon]|nr:ATP-grasp domain-containing protein [ANME-2 cluster archaeon]MBC2700752.1 ATP-grasp domain-containing protein [ANME-2 cluster archaeon]MBC2709033.1 ATP-grasp domain-containing protein [ANME-2 cluster archaeon]MBC2747293.1 ATP-grasp domain-containing protein [ANME-2 cluster archaeon]MBC2764054.1 ATP-grasp domain-containing protein [ANME-2 cluster archaeon]